MKLEGFDIMVDDTAVMVRFYRDGLGFQMEVDENTTNVLENRYGI